MPFDFFYKKQAKITKIACFYFALVGTSIALTFLNKYGHKYEHK